MASSYRHSKESYNVNI